MKRILMYISENYSFEILRPIQEEAQARGIEVCWFVEGDKVNLSYFSNDEVVFGQVKQAVEFKPDAVFVPGNIVPSFISGLKVQVFHGLEWKKKGHFRIRGCFDLYCTHGPITTDKFNQLANSDPHFSVVETGWPKLDCLFDAKALDVPGANGKKCILYAPTFSPSLTSAEYLYDVIKQLSESGEYYWVIKFHPKMDSGWVSKYKKLESHNLVVLETSEIASLLQRADLLVSDTSSIIGEFLLLNKPAITLNNSVPGPELIEISHAEMLPKAVQQAFELDSERQQAILKHNTQLHPTNDGKSAKRLMDAVASELSAPSARKAKPMNFLRNFKLRKKLKYWKL